MSLPPAVVILRRRKVPHAIAPPGAVVSTDAAFLRGLNSVVAVEFDRNSKGAAPGMRAGSSPHWVPVLGLEEVPCFIGRWKSFPVPGDSQLNFMRTARVLFGQSVAADSRYRLRYCTRHLGTIHLYLNGPVLDADGMGHHWVVDVRDRNHL